MPLPVTEILKGLRKTASDHSPLILTAIGVTGTVSTAVLTAKATMFATQHYESFRESNEEADVVFNRKDIASLYWKLYIPATASCVTTVACIIGANHISTKRSAALISAYSLTESAFKEYQAKVVEQMGTAKETQLRTDIAQEQLKKDPLGDRQIIMANGGDVLCYESMTGRYFKSDVETIRRAENNINSRILNDGYASQNDFFSEIGLGHTSIGDEMGWNTDNLLDLQFSAILSEDGKPCMSLGYRFTPIRYYYKNG